MNLSHRILVALDVDALNGPVGQLVTGLAPHVGGFKIGMQLATSIGVPQAADFLAERRGQMFLDQKFHDIPNTVEGAAAAATRIDGVTMFNVHCGGGSKMMSAAVAGRDKVMAEFALASLGHENLTATLMPPLVLGVTVLTSMNAETLKEIGYHQDMTVQEQVVRLAVLAAKSGLDGVVASAQEARAIRVALPGMDFKIVTPAIQPEWATWAQKGTDQQRPTTHLEALEAGADYLVIGRAILKAPDPVAAAQRIAEESAQVA